MREENQFSVLRFNPALQAFPPSHLGIVCKHPLPSVCRRFRFPFSVFRSPLSVYFIPLTCFSQAQAERRVSSSERSAFQPSSSFA